MTKKTIFSIDGSAISNLMSQLFTYLKESRFKISKRENTTTVNMPLYLALILTFIFPVITITAIIIFLVLSYKITLERETKTEQLSIDSK